MKPTMINTNENRNGTRQPHARKASPGAISCMSASIADASSIPTSPKLWEIPDSPWCFRTGACSTDMSTAPPHSPPADKPCRIRRKIRMIGAAIPIES